MHRSVERAIGYLQTESGAWLKHGRCAACHHAAMPLWALSEAGKRGYAIDAKFVTGAVEKALGSRQGMISSGIAPDPTRPPDPRPMGRGVNLGAVFMAVAAESLESLDDGEKESLKRIAGEIVTKQQKDGSWEFFLSRPPINESQATDAAWIIMALQSQGDVESNRAAMEKAIAWLDKAEPDNRQAKVLKLLVAIRSGQSRENLRAALREVMSLQRPDGGWSQTAELPSDAFATGETLYVLSLAGYSAEQEPIRRGIEFLLATQKPDGSWPMISRATPDGRPGSAKLLTPITCGAASWATLALARLRPETDSAKANVQLEK